MTMTLAGDLSSPVAQLQALRHSQRVWRPFLTSTERDLLVYVFDNSVLRGRLTFRASLTQMVEGVKGWLTSAGLSRSTLKRTFTGLIARGLLRLIPGARMDQCATYEVNLDWEPSVMAIAIPKRLRAEQPSLDLAADLTGSTMNPGRVQIDQGRVHDEPSYQRSSSEEENRATLRAEPVEGDALPLVIPQVIRPRVRRIMPSALPAPVAPVKALAPLAPPTAAAHGLIRPMRTAKQAVLDVLQKVRGAKPVTNDIVWRDAWAEAFPGQQPKPLGNIERKMLMTLRARLEIGNKSFDWFDFLGFVVIEWRAIRDRDFAWMTAKPSPEHPDVRFMCSQKFTTKFFDAYARRHDKRELEAATGDRETYLRLTQNGMTHDEAVREMGKQDAHVALAQERKRALDHLTGQARSLQIERERLAQRQAQPIERAPPAPAEGHTKLIDRPPVNHGCNPWENPHLIYVEDVPFRAFEG